jgi:hypothetical protein
MGREVNMFLKGPKLILIAVSVAFATGGANLYAAGDDIDAVDRGMFRSIRKQEDKIKNLKQQAANNPSKKKEAVKEEFKLQDMMEEWDQYLACRKGMNPPGCWDI